ncbi:MAG: hypothetical protein ABH828_06220 [archaeon]
MKLYCKGDEVIMRSYIANGISKNTEFFTSKRHAWKVETPMNLDESLVISADIPNSVIDEHFANTTIKKNNDEVLVYTAKDNVKVYDNNISFSAIKHLIT